MKISILLLLLLPCLTVGTCYQDCLEINYSVSSDCSPSACLNTQIFSTEQGQWFNCPNPGKGIAQLTKYSNIYTAPTFSFTATVSGSTNTLEMDLSFNSDFADTGMQYYVSLQGVYTLVLLNCTIPYSKTISSLCDSHDLVGLKFSSYSLLPNCSFGLDFSSQRDLRNVAEE